MKKPITLLVILSLLLITTPSQAQTLQKEFLKNNAKLCKAVFLPARCTKAEYDAKLAELTVANEALAAPAKVALPTGTYYADKESFRDAEILPGLLSARNEVRKEEILAAVIRKFRDVSGDDKVAVCTILKIFDDPEDCR